jgi:hypothetical protein
MKTYIVPLGDGRSVRVQAASPQAADQVANDYLRANPKPGARGQAGYVRARQRENRTEAKISGSRRLPGSDFQRRIAGSLGVSDDIGAAFATAGQFGENIYRRVTGKPIEITAEQAGLAAADTEREWQERYARENPNKNVFATGLGIAVGGVPKAGAQIITAPFRAGGAAAVANAPFALGRQEGNLFERLPGAATETAMAFGFGSALTAGGNTLRRSGAATRTAPRSDARKLADQGVLLTPGQMAGGFAQRAEDAMTSWPIFGDSIRNAQIRGIDSLDRAAINQTLAPIGEQLPRNATMGRGAMATAYEKVGDAYDAALRGVTVAEDPQFAANMQAALSSRQLPEDAARQVDAVIKNSVTPRLVPGQPLDGDTWKAVDSELRAAIDSATLASASSPSMRYAAQTLIDIRQAWKALLERSNPAARTAVQSADNARALLGRVGDASQSAGTAARGGLFSAANLDRAVRAGDNTPGNVQYQTGEALLQDLTDPAMNVLPSTVPDSGTPLRSVFAAGGGAALFGQLGWATPEQMIAGMVGLGLGTAAYSRPAQAAINALYRAKSPGQVREVLGAFGQEAARNPQLAPVYAEIVRALGAPLPASSRPPSPQGLQPVPTTP